MGIAGMILGILAVVFAIIPIIGWIISIPCLLIGLPLSIIGLLQNRKRGHGYGMAIAGIVTNVVAIVVVILWIFLFVASTEVTDVELGVHGRARSSHASHLPTRQPHPPRQHLRGSSTTPRRQPPAPTGTQVGPGAASSWRRCPTNRWCTTWSTDR